MISLFCTKQSCLSGRRWIRRAAAVTTALTLCFILLSSGCVFGQTATLDLHLTSADKPAIARVYIEDPGEFPQIVPGALIDPKGERHSIIDGEAGVLVTPGRYRIRAEKGPEYGVFERSVNLVSGETLRLDANIPRLVDMNAEGWYSGDLHLHRVAKEMPAMLRAENLNVGPMITRWTDEHGQGDPFPDTDVVRVDDSHSYGLHVQEVERNHFGGGAMLVFNMAHPLKEHISPSFPTAAMLSLSAKAEGGFVDAEKPIWKFVPIALAVGSIDSTEVINNTYHPRDSILDSAGIASGIINREDPAYFTSAGFAQWMMSLYYSYLNCGFRLAASAGTASGVYASWPGYERVYVYLSGPFSYQQWFKDLKAGRSFATNGPLLRVMVDGKPPGMTVEWHPGTTAHLDVRIDSQKPLDRMEVVFNGKVIRTVRLSGRRSYHSALPIPISESGWLAVRCFDPVTDTVVYAQTSPFYFTHNGKLSVQAADARRWAKYAHDLAAQTDPKLYPSEQDYKRVVAERNQAAQIYDGLAAHAERPRNESAAISK